MADTPTAEETIATPFHCLSRRFKRFRLPTLRFVIRSTELFRLPRRPKAIVRRGSLQAAFLYITSIQLRRNVVLVENVMSSPVISVEHNVRLDDAYSLMQERSIRHLPVVDGKAIVGVVTDRDLRLATSGLSTQPFNASASVADVMSHPPLTVSPIDPAEEAARPMMMRKIGCLPVEGDVDHVGSVTGTELLEALIPLTAAAHASSRIEVRCRDQADVARVRQLREERRVDVLWMHTYEDDSGEDLTGAEDDAGTRSAVLRTSTINPR